MPADSDLVYFYFFFKMVQLEGLAGRATSFLSSSTGRTLVTIAGTTLAVLSLQQLSRTRMRKALRSQVEEAMASQQRKRKSVQGGSQFDHLSELGDADDDSPSDQEEPSSFDEGLIREFLARNYAFLGEKGCQQVRDAFVVVVGLGGVGSMCATMLARSGVGKIRCTTLADMLTGEPRSLFGMPSLCRIIDFDQVTLSSLNVLLLPFALPSR